MANLQVGVAGNGTVTVGAGASVHSPANNTLTLGTNNSERIRITSGGALKLPDGAPLELGGAQDGAGDLKIYHTAGSHSYIDALGGSSELQLRVNTNEAAFVAVPDSGVYLYFNGLDRLITTSTGAEVKSNTGDTELKIKAYNTTSQSRLLFTDSSGIDGNVSYDHNDRKMYLGTAASGGLDGDLTIDSTGNVTVGTGNLVIGTAGKGIDFSAQTQSGSTTDDEILDHYEKGKWTPVVKKNDVANGTADVIHGRYVRIGKFCWLSMYARWNSGSNAQGTSGGWTIHGLPFSLQDDDPGNCRIYQSAPAGYFTIDGNDHTADDVRWQINTSTYFDLYTHTSSADQAWTTGMMAVGFTGAFMIHE